MNAKKTMLILATTALALAALPAAASATPHMANLSEDRSFAVEGGTLLLLTASERNYHCESVEGEGEFDETGEAGWIEFTFQECIEGVLFSKCTSAGESSGTITTEKLPFDLKTTTKDQTPAILITPNEETETFAHFTCAGGFIKVTVEGNGIIGEIASGYPGQSETFEVQFGADFPPVIQTPKTVDETPEIEYGLTLIRNGGKPDASGWNFGFTSTFAEGEPTLTPTAGE